MTLYDRLASTEAGARALAQARIRREVLRCLHQAQTASGVSADQIATRTGERRRDVRRAFNGDGNLPMAVLARYLHAMGYEIELNMVTAGEPRRKVVADSGEPGCRRWQDVRPRIVTDEARVAEQRADMEQEIDADVAKAQLRGEGATG